jgi:esterase/lipase superfamily enzyme
LTVIAGVGVLLLAMGVGVLIGRAGASKQSAAPAQVITLASPTSAGTGTGTGSTEASFTGSWPSGTSGYTVQLQTLPQSGTAVSAVEAAKMAASAKGAKAVGALKSEEFSSLTAGSYVIYSGVYHKKPEAEKALGALKKSFPAARVIKVSNGGSSASSSEPSTTSPGGVGESESKPAPPSVLDKLKGAHGKSYAEKSKELPDVVED